MMSYLEGRMPDSDAPAISHINGFGWWNEI